MATADTKDETLDFPSRTRVISAQLSQLTKLYNELERNMSSYENKDSAKSLYSKLSDRFEQFRSAHLQRLDLCTESDAVNNLEQNFDSCQKNFAEFQERYSQWIKKGERPISEENDGSSHSSRTTSCASVSSQSRLRSAKAKRLIAELKLEKLSKRQELERAQRELQLQHQLFEQQCEVDEAALEESVWQKAVNEENDKTTESTVVPSLPPTR